MPPPHSIASATLAAAMLAAGAGAAAAQTPIAHVIVVIGENRSFDSVFGSYVPGAGQSIENLLSAGIVDADGAPGPDFAAAAQYALDTPLPPDYFLGSGGGKTAYATLPPPQLNGAANAYASLSQLVADPGGVRPPFDATLTPYLAALEPALPPAALGLLQTGATGAAGAGGTDTRIPNATALPDTVFPLTSATLPYDAYAGGMTHRFYQMWQQLDCDTGNATPADPSGCLADLYPWVTVGDGTGGNAMSFFNMQAGDAPYLQSLARRYALSDNYHQGVMGGTTANHIMLGTGDVLAWTAFEGMASPPASAISNPNPVSPASQTYVADRVWTDCSDPAQPGVAAILAYLGSLPYAPPAECAPGAYYMLNNLDPGFHADGTLAAAGILSGGNAPPSPLRTIGEALSGANLSWAYYGGGYAAALAVDGGAMDWEDQYRATGYCGDCNFEQYAGAIMADPAARAAHLADAAQFFADLDGGRLPAVSFVKPDTRIDGTPGDSKLDLFEAFLHRIVGAVRSHKRVFAHSVIIVTFDESGGLWDSGYVQPLDFFGDGPRVPLLMISPLAKHGHVLHTYADHASILKFIERNWGLAPLSARSRDTLPNPLPTPSNPYVPANPPAIGDLFDMLKGN